MTNQKLHFKHKAVKIMTCSALASILAMAPGVYLSTHGISGYPLAHAESSCFIAGTQVLLANGQWKAIEQITRGEWVVGKDGAHNKVTGIERVPLGARKLYSLNGTAHFVTAEHPFMTVAGWKSIDPERTAAENPNLQIPTLGLNDRLVKLQAYQAAPESQGNLAVDTAPEITFALEALTSIEAIEADPEMTVYNLLLDGNHSYIADGFLVHNKGGGSSSCFIAGTQVLLANGQWKAIEQITRGEWVVGKDGAHNKVTGIERVPLGARKLYSLNGTAHFVTAEHPFMTVAGWKSIDPERTAAENPNLQIPTLGLNDRLVKLQAYQAAPESQGNLAVDTAPEITFALEALTSIEAIEADPEMTVYNLLLDGNHSYIADGFLVHNKGGGSSSCFIAGTQVLLANGQWKAIEQITRGEWVVGKDGAHNKVTGIERVPLGARKLYSLNGTAHFVTAEHPFMTVAGWKSIDPERTAAENPNLQIPTLGLNDRLVKLQAYQAAPESQGNLAVDTAPEITFALETLSSIEAIEADPEMTVYNLLLDGNHSYIADGFLVHNKGGGSSSCFIAGTQVLLANGQWKAIEQIVRGEWVVGKDGAHNKVTGIERVPLGARKLYSLNGTAHFVTAEHPFMTVAGWKSIDPERTAAENPNLQIPTLGLNDRLVKLQAYQTAPESQGNLAVDTAPEITFALEALTSIEAIEADPEMTVYNLLLDGNHSYIADGFLVHNKGGGDGGGDSGGDGGGDSDGDGGRSGDDSGSRGDSDDGSDSSSNDSDNGSDDSSNDSDDSSDDSSNDSDDSSDDSSNDSDDSSDDSSNDSDDSSDDSSNDSDDSSDDSSNDSDDSSDDSSNDADDSSDDSSNDSDDSSDDSSNDSDDSSDDSSNDSDDSSDDSSNDSDDSSDDSSNDSDDSSDDSSNDSDDSSDDSSNDSDDSSDDSSNDSDDSSDDSSNDADDSSDDSGGLSGRGLSKSEEAGAIAEGWK